MGIFIFIHFELPFYSDRLLLPTHSLPLLEENLDNYSPACICPVNNLSMRKTWRILSIKQKIPTLRQDKNT